MGGGGDSPRQILSKYFSNHQVQAELPSDYSTAYNSGSPVRAEGDARLNYFKSDAGLSYAHWLQQGWIIAEAPEGWFEAYCSYVAGKLPDEVWLPQLLRAKSCIARHAGQVYSASNLRPRQRQTLLNWASPLAFLVQNK